MDDRDIDKWIDEEQQKIWDKEDPLWRKVLEWVHEINNLQTDAACDLAERDLQDLLEAVKMRREVLKSSPLPEIEIPF